MRELQAQWMINGHGGYTVHRLTIKIPSAYSVLLALSFIVLAWEVWFMWRK